MSLRIAAIFLFVLVVRLPAGFAQQTPTVFPFEPAQMLGVLPTAPPEWKVLRSDADLTLGEWLETRATRVFQEPPPPANPAGGSVSQGTPGEIEISVADTTGFSPALAAFAGFTPSRNGNVEKKLIGSLPAIIITNDNGRTFAQLLVSTRFLVELTLTNLPRHRIEDWLKAFHFDSLPQTSKTPTAQVREFRLTHVDELQPKKTRSYVVSTTNAKRVDAFLKTLPPAAAEPAPKAGGQP